MKALLLIGMALCLGGCGNRLVYDGKYSTSVWDGEKLVITPKAAVVKEISGGRLKVEPTK